MKKLILCVAFWVSFCSFLKAQTPQFAVVRPSGATQVYTSWVSAYAGALDGDFIYLPGNTITGTISIGKKLHIFGTGIHPDSSSATGRTVLNGILNILGGASEGSIEGVRINNTIFLAPDNIHKVHNYTIKRCEISDIYLGLGSMLPDSLPEYVQIVESIIKNTVYGSNSINNSFNKNIINRLIYDLSFCTFENNIFGAYANLFSCANISNSLFENNIFLDSDPAPYNYGNCNNIFSNNLKLTTPIFSENQSCPVNAQSENISVSDINSIFLSFSNNESNYYIDNFHLNPSCPGVGAGNDGTDVGIYGTNNPTPPGWVPSNPHIYFKQVDGETGSDGKLHIQVGVRANNQ